MLNRIHVELKLAYTPYPDYQKPFHWWGYVWPTPSPATLAALITGQMLTLEHAALLIEALNSGKSLAVVSDAPRAGKSTLLWALATAARVDVPKIYIRGQYEPFAFDHPVETSSASAILMINEVSPHLPVYCWGPVRDRLFGLEFAHLQKVATAHASSLTAFVSSWNSWSGPGRDRLNKPFDFGVFLSSDERGHSPSRVSEIRNFD